MNLSLSQSDPVPEGWVDDRTLGALRAIAEGIGPFGAAVDVVLVDDDAIRAINRDYRGKDRATDVISFSYLEDEPMDDDDPVGEIYISYETLEKEATEVGVDVSAMLIRITVHGLLHVVGHDHESDEDAARMEREERQVLEGYLEPGDIAALL